MENINKSYKLIIDTTMPAGSQKQQKEYFLPSISSQYTSNLQKFSRPKLENTTNVNLNSTTAASQSQFASSTHLGKDQAKKTSLMFKGKDNYLQMLTKIQKEFAKEQPEKHKFKLNKNLKTLPKISGLLQNQIKSKVVFSGTEDKIFLKEFESKNIYKSGTFDFAEQLVENGKISEKKFGFKEKNLKKNRLLLEFVVLERVQEQLKSIKDRIKARKAAIIEQNNKK